MSLNPSGSSASWNFSRPNDPGYSLELWGTVVSLQEVQARMYNPNSNQPGAPRTWPDGNPVMNIRMGLAMPDGSLRSFTFGKAGKKQQSGEKPSVHMDLFKLTNGNMMDLIGKTLHFVTWPAHPKTGEKWGQGNPRLFEIEEVIGTTYTLNGTLPYEYTIPELLCDDGAHAGQPVPQAPSQIQAPPMQGQYYQAPQAAPASQSQYETVRPGGMAPQQVIPQQQAPAPQPAQQAPAPVPQQQVPQQVAQAPMPQGMDPAVAAAMQAVGAVNVQPVIDTQPSVYDDSIPF